MRTVPCLSPHAARRHLHEREVVPARVRERRGVEVGEVLGEGGAQLGGGERSLVEQGAARPAAPVRGRRARSARREVAVRGELAVEHGLDERAEHDGVVGA